MKRKANGFKDLNQDRLAEAEDWSRRLIIPLADGNLDAIAACLKDYMDQVVRKRVGQRGLDTPLAEMGISLRTLNSVENHLGAVTLRDLLGNKRQDLLYVPHVNLTTIIDMYERIIAWFVRQLPDGPTGDE